MKSLSKRRIWLFAVGQLGWSLLSGIIANWLVYVYQPSSGEGEHLYFIPQGLVVFGIFTIIGGITALGRVFDAFTDPWIASLSDRCKSPKGRRMPFLKWASFPLAACTLLIFCAPVKGVSWINVVWILIFVMGYYLAITAYCAPYNALISELGHTQEERMMISTAISLTFIVGTAASMQAASVWNIFMNHGMERMLAIRLTFFIFSVVALLAMLVPVLAIKEKDYVNTKPSEAKAGVSLVKTLKNKDFRIFVASDIFYWIAMTMFQTGLVFFVTKLLKLEESVSGFLFIVMTALSLLFYIPVNILVKKIGKKKLVLLAFAMFSIAYLYTGAMGNLPLPPMVQGYILAVISAFPMAILGIVPQAMVADVAEADAIQTGENREGMFFAARTFAFKLGQSVAMLIFTSIATLENGYRLVAVTACVFCLIGGGLLYFYNEKRICEILER